MKKLSFFTLILVLFACVFANAQSVSQQLEKAKNDYLFGNGAYAVGAGTEQVYEVDFWSGQEILLIPKGTVGIIKVYTFPLSPTDVTATYFGVTNKCEQLSNGDNYLQFKYTADDITGYADELIFQSFEGDFFRLSFIVEEDQKKDFTVKANNSKIDAEQTLDLSESDFSIKVYGNNSLLPCSDYTVSDPETTEGNLSVSINKFYDNLFISYVSGSGKVKLTVSYEGYNDFVFYLDYKETHSVKIFSGETDVTGQTLEMNVLDFATFTAEVESETLSNKVTWSTSDWNVVRILSNGAYNAKKLGTATITCASIDNPEVFSTVIINVVPISEVSVSIEGESEITLNKGDVRTLIAKVLPETETQAVTWTSDNWNAVSVVNGKITAKNLGTATITATAKADSSKSANVVVNVVPVAESTIEILGGKSSIETGEVLNLTAVITPSTESQAVVWSTSDWSVARVINGVVTGKKEGTVTITATSKANPELSTSITVTVVKEIEGIPTEMETMDI